MILAPVAREQQGRVRRTVRRDAGAAATCASASTASRTNSTTLPKLKKTEKHDIDVVIDRLQGAARHAAAPGRELRGGAAPGRRPRHRAGNGATGDSEHLFNAKFACPICHYSISRTGAAPVLVQLAGGRLPALRRPGPPRVLRPARVVAFPTLSLASGAIKGWDRRNGYYFSMLESLAKHYKFDVDAPFEELPAAVQQARAARLGRGGDQVQLHDGIGRIGRQEGDARSTPSKASSRTWSGATARPIRPRCARSWRATAACSPAPTATARGCAREARHVFLVDDRTPSQAHGDLRDQPRHAAREPRRTSDSLHLHGAKAEIADKVVREIGAAAEVPERRRPQLPEPGPQRRDAVGRRGAAHPPGLADRLGPDRRDVRAGRAQHRPAPARQRPADRHAASICATSATA